MMTALEAHELLVRGADGSEILLHELDGRRLVTGAVKEKEWHVEGEPESRQIDRLQLVVELAPRELHALHQRRVFSQIVVSRERSRTRAHGIPIPIGEHVRPFPQYFQRLPIGEGRWADCAQSGERLRVAGAFRLSHLPLIVELLVAPLVDELSRSHISGKELRPPFDQMDAEHSAPGVTDRHDFCPAERGGQILDDGDGIVHHAADRQTAASGLAILRKRAPRAPLVPMHDGEVFFPGLPGLRDRHGRSARSAMQIEQHRGVRRSPHLNPLLDTADRHVHLHNVIRGRIGCADPGGDFYLRCPRSRRSCAYSR